MSDFAGIWRLDGQPVDDADLRRLANGLDGRGTAPARVWRSGAMGIVHRQTFFTPEDRAERQPLVAPSGAVLAADLRLNERPALVRALGLGDDALRLADGALLSRALDAFGLDATLERLFGEFAFALWRPEERRLVLARDSTGRRSLFAHRGARLVAFATRLRPLLGLPDVPQDLDDEALADRLVLNLGPPARTLYRGIDRVPLGHVAEHTPSSGRLRAYWDLPEPGSSKLRGDADIEEAAREVLDRAVADALRSEGPVTAWLTGGLDTANVVASAARQLAPGGLTAATLKPGGPTPPDTQRCYYDETGRAGALAAMHPNVDWHVVSGADGGDWGEHDPRRAFLELGAPTRAPLNIAWFYPMYRFMAARGSRVSLGGEMGNAFFSDSGLSLLPELFLTLRWGELARHLLALRRGGHAVRSLAGQTLAPLAPYWLMQWRTGPAGAPWSGHSPINPGFARDARLDERVDRRLYRIRLGHGHASAQARRRWISQDHVAYDLVNAQRARTGVDHRLPLADRRVVEFFGALPLAQFLEGGATRSLAKRLLRGQAPPKTIENADGGRQNGDWFALMSAARPAMREEMTRLRASPVARRVVDLDRLQALLDHWPTDAASAEPRRYEYYQMLARGMEMARFLAWREGGNG